jgi:hypothetical protein
MGHIKQRLSVSGLTGRTWKQQLRFIGYLIVQGPSAAVKKKVDWLLVSTVPFNFIDNFCKKTYINSCKDKP